ncbi:UNVERIFIED_CONTAM: hypothetical protein GTU68_021109 [Idotea baltica]|nr:hypothetical protein [Idotea baltica]
MKAIEAQTQAFVSNTDRVVNGIITIPTVVHVIYSNSNENISNAQIQSQIDVLNLDFRLLNTDATNTWSQDADSEIEFCLASVDPNGNSTTGITRTSSSTTSWGTNDAMKFASNGGVDAWPTGEYLNLWVCNIGGGILGYAQFPGGSSSTDGVVVGPNYFGTTGYLSSPFDLGRTTTHEVGHWLNLRHIWGDGNCNVDDFVADTPTSDAANYGCATGHTSCGTTDMVENYMDYSDDACMHLFTEGQKTRMRALFDTGGFRESLLNSGGCGTGGTGATCSDGIQNQGETGIDCGGPCAACPTSCSDTEVVISITLDNYPEETSWTLTNSSGGTVASGGTYGSEPDGSTVTITDCLVDGCYDFTINDAYGDGICCGYGNGSYSVTAGGSTVASGGSFNASETTNFCIGGTAPTCNDGIQNQGETGVDCGGPCTACPTCNDGIQNQGETGVDCGGPCSPCVDPATCNDGIQNQGETGVDCGGPCTACPTCNDGIQNQGETGVDCGGPCSPCGGGACSIVDIDFENFESGWGIWNDGGSDCARINYAPYAASGSRTIRIRDNSGVASSMTTDNLNLTGFEEVQIDFTYYPVGMETGEDFWLQGSLDGGSTWTTVGTWARPDDFQNGSFYSESIVITGDYTSTTQWRFRCDASVNNDRIYMDDINITGCVSGSREVEPGEIVGEIIEAVSIVEDNELTLSDMKVFPNPTRDLLNINYAISSEAEVEMFIYDLNGKVISRDVFRSESGNQKRQFDVTELWMQIFIH